MADNTTLNTGSGGDVIATDDIAGVKHQRVKVEFGADGSASDVSGSNGLPVRASTASAATLSNTSASATNVTLLASNSSRLGAIIVNDSAATLYVKFGATASSTSYTYRVDPYGVLEFPGPGVPVYTGIVDGIWDSATGAARATELT